MAERGLGRGRRSGGGPHRLTLGLVTANIHLGVGATLWSGVLAAAERNDVNLVCFPGGPLRPGGAPRNELYELISADRLDGVICWTSTLSLPAARDRAQHFARRLDDLPVISLNRELDGHETLLLDSYSGMREAVSHLVEDHGRRRLACIRGPLANPVSLDRYRAFTEALARHRIPQDRSLVSASVDFGSGSGAAAMRVLLDVRGLVPGRDFDAVVACSDALAADALRFLGGRGIRVPEDVAVISFNDSLEARLSDPPLTSVALPFAELGALAVNTLLARIHGTRPPSRSAVSGTLVTRRSCGCHSPLVAQGAPDAPSPDSGLPGTSPLSGRGRGGRPRPTVAAMASAPALSRPAARVDAPTVAVGRAGRFDDAFAVLPAAGAELARAFRADLGLTDLGRTERGRPDLARADLARTEQGRPPDGPGDGPDGPGGAFLHLLERLLGGQVHTFSDAATWDRGLLHIRGHLVHRLSFATRSRAERLLGQARLMVADKSHRLLEYERWAEEQESRRLRELGTTLTTAVDIDALTSALTRHLPGTGVSGCRLALYADGPRHPGGGRDTARLVLTPSERQNRPPSSGSHRSDRPAADLHEASYSAPYPAALLLPDEVLPESQRYTLVAEPLHIGDEQLGFALFDAERGAAHRGALYRALGDQISAALKGIRLFDEVRRARDAAEHASQLKTRLLDNATDELRTPVEAILRHTHPPHSSDEPDLSAALSLAHQHAGQLLRLIDDLLDLSRSEIDALDLSRRLLDPGPLFVDAFHSVARTHPGGDNWRLQVPRRLPAVHADGPRLRQILLNLLAAAATHSTSRGQLLLTAEIQPPLLSVRITGTDLDVPPGEAEHLFQPFASGEPGMRLGLAIARRLAVLHGGSVNLERGERSDGLDGGSGTGVGVGVGVGVRGFHLVLPLPTPAEPLGPPAEPPPRGAEQSGTVLVAAVPPAELAALAQQEGLRLHRLQPDDDPATLAVATGPAAVAWDVGQARPQEWFAVQRLHDHPALRHTPFLLYGPVAGADLAGALHALRPAGLTSPALVVDGSAAVRDQLRHLLTGVLPGREVRAAADGTAALALLEQDVPCLLVVARVLPDMDGFDVVERLSDTAGQAGIPVLLLSDRGFSFGDVRRADPHPGLVLLGRDILTEEETAALLTAMMERAEPGNHRGSAPVRHALAYIEQHYRHQFSRWQVAQSAGVSEDHLSRLFHREFGLTLWEYLTRLRIQRAKERLRQTDESVQSVARAVGFHDRAYFSRVFRKLTGVAPHAYRESG